jgi:hypothetical protein
VVPDQPVQASGWKLSSISIPLPSENAKIRFTEEEAPKYDVKNVLHRDISLRLSARLSRAKSSSASTPNLSSTCGSELLERNPCASSTKSFDADDILEYQKKLIKYPPVLGCTLETMIVSLMFWSDATHLASFGTHSAWPIYMYSGNQSNYEREKPSSGSANHIAYIPKVTIPILIV